VPFQARGFRYGSCCCKKMMSNGAKYSVKGRERTCCGLGEGVWSDRVDNAGEYAAPEDEPSVEVVTDMVNRVADGEGVFACVMMIVMGKKSVKRKRREGGCCQSRTWEIEIEPGTVVRKRCGMVREGPAEAARI